MLQAQPPPLSAIEALTAPIALYPDPLVALILPAATHPDDIEWAVKHPAFDSADPSVQSLEHYPDVLRWMAANAAWTEQLGATFASDPAATMAAIQDLRQRARSDGTLANSNFVRVVVDPDGSIELLPVQPDTLYVPSYDPDMVFVGPGDIDWGQPFPTGPWLNFEIGWRDQRIRQGNAVWHPPSHVAVTSRSEAAADPRPSVRTPARPTPLRPPHGRAAPIPQRSPSPYTDKDRTRS